MEEILKQIKSLGEFSQEDFDKGYNPVGEAIDDYENRNTLSQLDNDDIDDYLETENFLDEMASVEEGDENYETLYSINYYGYVFEYSKKEDDIFYEVWKTWDGKFLDGGKSGMWYYYFINRRIMEKYYYNDFQPELELCDMEAQTDCHILIDNDSDDDDPTRDAGADFINEFWPVQP